jgi:FMN phosphatase YigB (HAD superfamily)
MSEIKFIYFDLGGVLVNIERIKHDLAILCGEEPKDFGDILEKINWQAAKGQIDTASLWNHYQSDFFKVKIAPISYEDFFQERISGYIQTYEYVKELSKNYPIGILSNIENGIFEVLTEKGFIPPIQFHTIIKSYEVGFAKPEVEIYRIAEERSGFKGQEILFIDDRIMNLEPAEKLGWQTFQFESLNPSKSIKEIKTILSSSSI